MPLSLFQTREGAVAASSTPFLAWKILVPIIQVLSSSVALWRIIYRYKLRRLQLADYVASLVGVVGLAMVGVFWAAAYEKDEKKTQSLYIFGINVYFVVIWLTRVTIILAIGESLPTIKWRELNWYKALAVAFLVVNASFLAAANYLCMSNVGWKDAAHPQSPLPLKFIIIALIIDGLADIHAVVAPIFHLGRTSANSDIKSRFNMAVAGSAWLFCATLTCSCVAFFHPVHIRVNIFLASIAVAISVFISNYYVVIPVLYRRMQDARYRGMLRPRETPSGQLVIPIEFTYTLKSDGKAQAISTMPIFASD